MHGECLLRHLLRSSFRDNLGGIYDIGRLDVEFVESFLPPDHVLLLFQLRLKVMGLLLKRQLLLLEQED